MLAGTLVTIPADISKILLHYCELLRNNQLGVWLILDEGISIRPDMLEEISFINDQPVVSDLAVNETSLSRSVNESKKHARPQLGSS